VALSQSEVDAMKRRLAASSVPTQSEAQRLQKRLADINATPDRTLGETAALSGEAFARGAAQGATFGLADEVGGVLGMADEFLRRAVPGDSAGEFAQKPLGEALASRYEMEREANQREMERLREEAPAASAVGEIAGALVVPVPGAGVAGGLAMRGVRAAPALAGVRGAEAAARVAAQSALGAGLAGFGAGEGAAGSLGEALSSGLTSGVTAGVTSKAAQAASPFLKKFAEEAALKAVGAKAGITNALQKMGYESAAEARELGRKALDRKIVTFGATKDDVLARAQLLKEDAGQKIQDVTDLAERRGVVYNWLRSARKTAAPFANIDEQKQRAAGPVREFIEDILVQSGRQAPEQSFDAARRLKTSAQQVVTWDPATGSAPAKLKRQAVNAFTADFRKQVTEQLGKKVGKKLKDASDAYGAAVDMEKLSRNAATTEQQQRVFGLIGTGLGAGLGTTLGITSDSAALGGAVAVGVPLLEALARKRGPALSAVTADRLAKFAQKHGPKLQAAMEGGRAAKASTHFLLSQRDPEYRRDAEALEKQLKEAGVIAVP
jgi:hypothetical protein